MKVLGLPHIAIIPYVTCNFACSYCVASKFSQASLKKWDDQLEDNIKFLNSLDKKAILVSGGEPLLWKRWDSLIEATDHRWYFLTNGSVLPRFKSDKVAFFIVAFHRENIGIDKFISNLRKIQDMGYPVFCKIVYTKNKVQFDDWERIHQSGIPCSFAPLVGINYSDDEIKQILPYCDSAMYASRFLSLSDRKPALCLAGTSESFEWEGIKLHKCSHYDLPMMGNRVAPQFIKKAWCDKPKEIMVEISHVLLGRKNPVIGNIYQPKFYPEPVLCRRKSCDCEWHVFSEMSPCNENDRWNHFIETGKWESCSIEDVKRYAFSDKVLCSQK